MSSRTKLLMKENNELSKSLGEKADRVLTDIVVYIRSSGISEYRQELVRRDVLHMLLEGEARGESAEAVIGGDVKVFCDRILDELPRMSPKERFWSSMGNGCLYLAVFLAVWFLEKVAGALLGAAEWPRFFVTAGDLAGLVLIIVSAVGIFYAVSRRSFDESFLRSGPILMCLAAILLCVAARCFLTACLFRIHAAAAAAIIVLLLSVYKAVDVRID